MIFGGWRKSHASEKPDMNVIWGGIMGLANACQTEWWATEQRYTDQRQSNICTVAHIEH